MRAQPDSHNFPASVGPISLIQGRYGLVGNLELVTVDPQDGLWVHWFNSDPDGTPGPEPLQGPPPGEWSGGLRFAHGRRYTDVRMLQASHGPHFLEVAALDTDGGVRRFVWSPDAGFTEHESIAHDVAALADLSEASDGALVLHAAKRDGGPVAWRAEASDYPDLTWLPTDVPAPLPLGVVDGRTVRLAACADAVVEFPGPVTVLSSTASTRLGGSVELVARVSDSLQHATVEADGTILGPRPICTVAWPFADGSPIHRG